jgi:hypothetical protein
MSLPVLVYGKAIPLSSLAENKQFSRIPAPRERVMLVALTWSSQESLFVVVVSVRGKCGWKGAGWVREGGREY